MLKQCRCIYCRRIWLSPAHSLQCYTTGLVISTEREREREREKRRRPRDVITWRCQCNAIFNRTSVGPSDLYSMPPHSKAENSAAQSGRERKPIRVTYHLTLLKPPGARSALYRHVGLHKSCQTVSDGRPTMGAILLPISCSAVKFTTAHQWIMCREIMQ